MPAFVGIPGSFGGGGGDGKGGFCPLVSGTPGSVAGGGEVGLLSFGSGIAQWLIANWTLPSMTDAPTEKAAAWNHS